MSQKLQPVRGTHDILPDDFEKFHAVVTRARELATLYGFREMATPIFEMTEVFARSMGETSDVVSKEMFTFQTKGEESVTLRPEFTAGNVRAFISNGMQQHLPLKLFSTGPVFRYERPQKGRQRQFHQVNYEWLGDDSWQVDVEIILLAGQLLSSFSKDRCTLHINTLGDAKSRADYRHALVQYLTPYSEQLSEDSQHRLISNPLRILDSKSPEDKKILEAAPRMKDYLSEASSDRFKKIVAALKYNQGYFHHEIMEDDLLVRGLDYYTDTVFEFVSNSGDLGTQNTVLAGGRYDGLVTMMGGKPTPAIGFAAGVERLLLSLSEYDLKKYQDLKVVVLPEGISIDDVYTKSGLIRLKLWSLLKSHYTKRQCSVEIWWHGKLTKRLERAAQRGTTHAVMIFENEIKIKNMETREEITVTLDDLMNDKKYIELFNITELSFLLHGN